MRPQRNAGEYPGVVARSVGQPRASMRPQRNAGEYRWRDDGVDLSGAGFNEAPAKCRGIRRQRPNRIGRDELASMRPQRNAGEYFHLGGGLESERKASMRPQRNAGEYKIGAPLHVSGERASMRPQRNAGEYPPGAVVHGLDTGASMRPQRNAGEYFRPLSSTLSTLGGFNEAPAKCRGIRG